MLNTKRVLLTPVVLLSLATPAFAGVATTISLQDALSGRVKITVATEGGGTILDFSQTGEKIEKITIDDPSKVMTDHCLITKSCNGHPEPIVRLLRVNIPDKDIPAARSTQLTVMTSDESGQWNSYIFSVTPSTKPSVYTKYLIGGHLTPSRSNDVSAAAYGVRQAQQRGLLADPALKGRILTYLRLKQTGVSDRVAAKKAGVSLALVSRLNTLGQAALAQGQPRQPIALASPASTMTPKASSQDVAILPTNSALNTAVTGGATLPKQKKQKHKAGSKPVAVVATPQTKMPVPHTERPATSPEPTSATAIVPDAQGIFWAPPGSFEPLYQQSPLPSQSFTTAVRPVVARPVASASDGHTQANHLVKGLMVARRERKITPSTAASVQDVIWLLRKGRSLTDAVKRARVKMQTINQLLALAEG